MPKRFYKHKLLLDENMPHRTVFLLLNSQFDVKHVAADLKHSGLPDPDVYQLAVNQKRILVTYNTKHFRPLAGSKKDAGIIGVSANLPTPQVDSKLTALLTKSTPHALAQKFTPLTGETETYPVTPSPAKIYPPHLSITTAYRTSPQ